MKKLFKGCVTAFSMYSTIPMPQLEWDKDSMKYALCFFPFVGAVNGILIVLWNLLAVSLGFNVLLYSAGMVLIPLLISGAIHLDGFIDTSDARYSRRELEKKLEILKDPHVGAFGVIMCVCYLIAHLGLAGQFYENTKYIYIVALGFMLSRAMSGLSIVSFKTAKNSGLAYIFSTGADKKSVKIVMYIYVTLILATMVWINAIVGLSVAVISVSWFWIYKTMCYKEFGGLTGDLAGFFLQILELLILATAMIGGMIS